MEIPEKKRQYWVVGVILFFWARAIVLNVWFQEDSIALVTTAHGLFRTAALYGSINLAVLLGFWYWSGGKLPDLGWKKEGFKRHLGIGCLFGLAMLLQHYLLTGPLFRALIPSTENPGVDMALLFSNWADLPIWILLSIFKGGFEEELWRSFEINAFKRILGKGGIIIALLIGSAIFGLQHVYQGWDTVASTGFDGLLYGLIYLRKRSVVEAMAAHALFDIISILAGYLLI